MKSRNIKIRLESIKRTDLICVGCGCFRTEWAIVPALPPAALRYPAPDVEPVAGVHTRCLDSLHVKHTRKTVHGKEPESQ
jgi:hypothetical protein